MRRLISMLTNIDIDKLAKCLSECPRRRQCINFIFDEAFTQHLINRLEAMIEKCKKEGDWKNKAVMW